MLNALTLEDKKLVEPYLQLADYEGYNSNFNTWMMWNEFYNIQYYCNENFLVVFSHYGDLIFWNMPYTTKEYFKEAMDFMITYSNTHGFPFLMDGVLNQQITWIKEIYGDQFLSCFKRGSFDYVYEAQQLTSLSGKKMQKRRNHYNYFIKEYQDNFIYKTMDSSDFDNILTLTKEWSNTKEVGTSIKQEINGIKYVLDNYKALDIKGGCIYINNKLEAYTIGSKLNHKTVQIHVEKANSKIRGLYVAISKHFLECEFEGFLYVNREDDLDIEALRTAKMQLKPLKLLEKSFVYPSTYQMMKATNEDRDVIKRMWIENFQEDSLDFVDFYFDTIYQLETTYVLKIKNLIVSVLQMNPIEIMMKQKKESVSFVVGVCTHHYFRRLGFMRNLLEYALQLHSNEAFIVLQAYNWNIYKPFDFKIRYYKKKVRIDTLINNNDCIDNLEIMTSVCSKDLLLIYQQYTKEKEGYRIRDIAYYQEYLLPCIKIEDYRILSGYSTNQIQTYVIYAIKEDYIHIREAIFLNRESLFSLLKHLQETYKIKTIDLEIAIDDFEIDGQVIVPFMMLKENHLSIDEESLFINEYL